ncbi:MAG: hypothetical protein PHX44_00065 [Sulfurimonas sp.]|uniref:hypothetical protein n=1 Tax=Sulfurimonas sp. TaxID=2022749 RepID=UPI0026069411|nr:hypothetical protein [Sulfurimonas sp.]MDD2651430.1 hypothetical protein [Sulfurimonas sp.]MDD3450971.1 hypothetical protein [Sulfurimonas sp.]
MNILLLNNNPVVKKLVTLSVQKTSDELHTAESVEAIEAGEYDLLIIDDALYSDEIMDEMASKISYRESLFICSKDAKEQGEFTKTLKKPFLPTDLVETLISLAKIVDTVNLEKTFGINDEDFDVADDALFHDFDTDESLDELENIDTLEEVEDLDTLEASDEDAYNEAALEDVKDECVLDKDELQEVQSLLEETEEDAEIEDFDDFDFDTMEEGKEEESFDFEDDALEAEDIKTQEEEPSETINEDLFSFEEEEIKEPEIEDELDFEEQEETEPQEEPEEEVEDILEEEDFEIEPEEALEEDSFEEENLEEEDLASQIQEAVDSLSDEDLQTELDEDILLNIGSLTSKDLKLAIGEEVQEEQPDLCDLAISQEDVTVEKAETKSSLESPSQSSNGVEALKKLLEVLSKEDIAASLQGMKININITLGDA